MDPKFLILRGMRCLACFAGEGDTGGGAGGSGATGSTTATGSSAGTENTGAGGSGEGSASGQAGSKPADQAIPKARFDEVNGALRDSKAELERIKAERQQQQDEEAVKRGEFEKLANDRKAKLDEATGHVKSLTAEVTKLSTIVKKQQDTVIAEWPEEVKTTDPADGQDDDKVDLDTRQKWIDKMTPLVKRLTESGANGSNGTARHGAPRSPKPAGQAPGEESANALEASLRRTGRYSF